MPRTLYNTKIKSQRKPWQKGVIPIQSLSLKYERNKKQRKLGIDLNEKYEEVKKLFYKHCGKMCLDAKCDPQDVLQEVCKGILIRNKGTCPFDEKKSAFSTYVVMVSRCVTTNYINKRNRHSQKETTGVEDTIEKTDYAIAHSCTVEDYDTILTIKEVRDHLAGNMRDIFDDLLLGHNVSHISKSRGIDSRKIKNYIEKIKKVLIPLGVAPC